MEKPVNFFTNRLRQLFAANAISYFCFMVKSEKINMRSIITKNPKWVLIEPTDRCNTQCLHCNHLGKVFGEDIQDKVVKIEYWTKSNHKIPRWIIELVIKFISRKLLAPQMTFQKYP